MLLTLLLFTLCASLHALPLDRHQPRCQIGSSCDACPPNHFSHACTECRSCSGAIQNETHGRCDDGEMGSGACLTSSSPSMPAFLTCLDLRQPCGVKFAKPGGDLVMTTLFTRVADPQRRVFRSCDIKNTTWYTSVRSLALSGLVLHDCMSPKDVVALQTQRIRFLRVDPPKTFSLNDYRFILYYSILSGQQLGASMFSEQRVNLKWSPPVSRVFMTDLFDVTFSGNPFELIFGDKYHLYVGSEGNALPYKWNLWMKKKAITCDIARNLTEVGTLLASSSLLNPGILGGPIISVLALLRSMTVHMFSSPPHVQRANCNMVVFNTCLQDMFSIDSVFTGFPLHSVYKGYQGVSTGAYIVHK